MSAYMYIYYHMSHLIVSDNHDPMLSMCISSGHQIDQTIMSVDKYQKWLGAPDPSFNHNNAREKHLNNTGMWLLDDPKYVGWKQDANSFMWIHGICECSSSHHGYSDRFVIAGCGKTIIWYVLESSISFFSSGSSSVIIEDLRRQQPRPTVIYFYFDVNDGTKITVQGLLCSMVLGLSASFGQVSLLEKVYENCQSGIQKPGRHDLLEVLRELLNGHSQVYIIVDALDECIEFDKLHQTIKTIVDWKIPGCHLLVTSRTEKYDMDDQHDIMEIKLSAEAVHADIASYVSAVLESSKLRKLKKTVQEEVKSALLDGAGGM
jgi:hypothetical protein